MTHFKNTLIAVSLIAVIFSTDAFAFRARTHHQNAAGGHTSSFGQSYRGANGGSFANGRRVQSDAAGNEYGASGAAATTANGGRFNRAGTFSRSADGSSTRQGGYQASGQQGSIVSSGSSTRNADGTVYGDRNTQINNAKTGINKDIDTSYATGQGVTRTATCTDAMGVSVACPTR